MKKIFVTSSGTGIGKTLVTCAVTKALKVSGKKVHAMKPVISGFNQNIVPNDLFYICEALGINYLTSLKNVNFAAFKLPFSPDMAARLQKIPEIKYNDLKKFIEAPMPKTEYLVVETSGGIMVPVNSKYTFLDLIEGSADKIILVSGSYLGALSHTLTNFKLLSDAGKKPGLLIVSQNFAKKDPLYIALPDTIKSLEKFISVPIIGVEKLTGAESAKINRLAKILTDAEILKIIEKKS